jgi:hypothetical protein
MGDGSTVEIERGGGRGAHLIKVFTYEKSVCEIFFKIAWTFCQFFKVVLIRLKNLWIMCVFKINACFLKDTDIKLNIEFYLSLRLHISK